jgi:hypothetical protein
MRFRMIGYGAARQRCPTGFRGRGRYFDDGVLRLFEFGAFALVAGAFAVGVDDMSLDSVAVVGMLSAVGFIVVFVAEDFVHRIW